MRSADAWHVVLGPLINVVAALACVEKANVTFPLRSHVLVKLVGPDRPTAFVTLVLHTSAPDFTMVELRWVVIAITLVAHSLAPLSSRSACAYSSALGAR